jgi:hypothetical protein
MKANYALGRQIQVAGMAYGPTCEQGVVFLFGRLAKKLGFTVEHVQVRFPDCIARRRGQLCRIEFEHWASHFADHRHDAKGVDVIVCWENDWESRPRRYQHIEIIDLKKYVGAAPRVFAVAYDGHEGEQDLDRLRRIRWTVPKSAQVDDLVVMYRAGKGASCIRDLWTIVGPFKEHKKGNREGWWPGLQAGLKILTRLGKPVLFSDLTSDPFTRELGIVKRRFIGKSDITEDWPLIYRKIVAKNTAAKRPLHDYIGD